MLIKNSHIKSLLLALISLNVGYTYATGVINIPANATAADITAAKEILETPTLDSSLYTLQEVTDDVDAGALTLRKYLYDSESNELTSVLYNVTFDPIHCTGDSNGIINKYRYDWVPKDDYLDLDSTTEFSCDIDVRSSSLGNWHFETDNIYLIKDISGMGGFTEINNPDGEQNELAFWTSGGDINHSFIGVEKTATGGDGGAIYNCRTVTGDNSCIDDINGHFIHNRIVNGAYVQNGGAICNNKGTINNINGSFIGNYIDGPQEAYGGAISNNSSTIGEINGDFIGNYINASTTGQGGAIFNDGTISEVNGDFIGNYNKQVGDDSDDTVSGGAISNSETIGEINGDFIGNYNKSTCYGDYKSVGNASIGGAISNEYSASIIKSIVGDFIGNYIDCSEIDTIRFAAGGAIYNCGDIATIAGDFIENYVYINRHSFSDCVTTGGAKAMGGAIYNDGTIDAVQSDFINNYARAENQYARGENQETIEASIGGAICNTGLIKSIEGNFIGNVAVYGGAIYNDGSITSIKGSFVKNVAESQTSHHSSACGGGYL
ncbi:MAG: hypothetical protein R3Y56_03720 [Akkermansia sp.]